MDQMETSVETQGQYFVRLGGKIPLTQTQQETEVETGVDDQRVLILNALGDDVGFSNRKRYVEATMVTRDGIKIVGADEINTISDFGLAFDIIRKLKAGNKLAEGTGLTVSESGGKQRKQIILGYINEAGESITTAISASGALAGAKPFSGTPEEFQSRVKKSIDQAESPHKMAIEKTSAQTKLANSAAEMISVLPPRA